LRDLAKKPCGDYGVSDILHLPVNVFNLISNISTSEVFVFISAVYLPYSSKTLLDSMRIFGGFYYYPSQSNNYSYLHRKNLKTGTEEIVQYSSRYENKKELFGYDWFDYGDIQAIRAY